MSDKPNSTSSNNEIDLGQLFEMLQNAFNRLFYGLLRTFVYLKKNLWKLALLVAIGIAIGLFLNTVIDKRLKNEVIVRPNFESVDYLYGVVEEIQANLKAKDTSFFKEMDIDVNDLSGLSISIEEIDNNEPDIDKRKENLKYLDALQSFKDNDFVIDVVKTEIFKKSVLTHLITFTHKNKDRGEEVARKVMDYINSNPHFKELKDVYLLNANARIKKNQELIEQIDGLVMAYSEQLSTSNNKGNGNSLLIDSENGLDITGLLTLKTKLVKEIEKKQLELAEQQNTIEIINFGKTQLVVKQFFNNGVVLIPLILILSFFALSFILYLNKKSKQLL